MTGRPRFFDTITGRLVRPILFMAVLMCVIVVPVRYWFSQVFIGNEFELGVAARVEQLSHIIEERWSVADLNAQLAKVQFHSEYDFAFVTDGADGKVIAASNPAWVGLGSRTVLAALPKLEYHGVTRTVALLQPRDYGKNAVTLHLRLDRGGVTRAAELSALIALAVLSALSLAMIFVVASVSWRGVQAPARSIIRFLKDYEEGGNIGALAPTAPRELQDINEALARTVAERREKDALLSKVLRGAADGILVIGEEGTIEVFNAAAERMFGYSAAEAIGRNVTLIMPEPEATQHTNAIKRYRASKQSRDTVFTAEVRGKRKDGSILPIRLSISEVCTNGRRRFAGIIYDVSAAQVAREKLLLSQKLLEALREAQTAFIATYDIKALCERLVEILLDSTGSEYGFLGEMLLKPTGEPYLLAHATTNIAWDAETQKLYEENQATGMVFCNMKTLFGAVATSGEPVIANDAANDPRKGGLPKGHLPLNSFLGLPIKAGGTLVGMAGIANRPGGYDRSHVELFTPFLLTAGNLILAYRSEMARRASEAALATALRDAEAANHAKSRFLATMSHEIRTPMNGVLGMLGALQQTTLDGQQREYAQIASDSGQSLLTLMNEILDLSKVEAGKMELELAPFDVKDLASDAIQLFKTNAKTKGLELSVEFAPLLQSRVIGDASRIRQILSNLIGNAVKFTDGGSVVLRVATEPGVANSVELKFDVTDSGIGITAEQQVRIFAPFTQADSSTTRKYGGTGLGLAICRELAELMHGSIDCTSQPGQGSRFTLKLMLERAKEAVAEAPARCPHLAAAPKKNAPLRILVAEDVAVNQKLLRVFLEPLGHHVDMAANGLEAVAAVERFGYDVVLMDIQMPEMDGFTATQKIREMAGRAGQTHIVALTANAMSGDRERCIQAGANDYISKPIKMTELYAALDRVPSNDVQQLQAAGA